MTYLFIANKENSTDYCRGCLMASYDSDFYMENHLTDEALVKFWAEYLYRNDNLSVNEAGYQIAIFSGGIKVWDDTEGGPTWDGFNQYDTEALDNSPGLYEELEEREAADKKQINALRKQAQAVVQARIANELAQKQKLERKEKKAQEDRDKKERFRTFQELKKEFDA